MSSSGLITLGLQQPEKRSAPSTGYVPFGSGGWGVFGGGRTSDAGEVVSEHTILGVSTVYSCIRILSESAASLPLKLYRRTPQGRIEAIDQLLHSLLSISPNPEMTAFTLVETLVKSLVLTGNAFAEIERTEAGEVYGLWPLSPRETWPVRLDNGMLAYETTDGELPGKSRTIMAADMLHMPMFPGYDGLIGLSPLQMNMQAFGQAIAADRFSSRFFRNYATPALAVKIPEEVDGKTKALMREDWERLQGGSNAHRVAILDQGMTIERIGLTADEAAYLETRKFLREEIAGVYGVPAYMLGSSERLSQNSAEQMSLSYVVDTLRPITNRLTSEITRKLLRPKPGQAAELVVEADFSERLRGDTAASTNYFKTAIQFGWMNPNEVRRALNLNEGPASLNVYQTPINMQNSERLLDPQTTPANRVDDSVEPLA